MALDLDASTLKVEVKSWNVEITMSLRESWNVEKLKCWRSWNVEKFQCWNLELKVETWKFYVLKGKLKCWNWKLKPSTFNFQLCKLKVEMLKVYSWQSS